MFHYSYYDSKNTPSAKFEQASLREIRNYNTKQKAAQNWCLIRMFPLMVGDLISKNNKPFSLILLLLDMDIIFAPKFTIEQTAILEDLIAQFITDLQSIFQNIKPTNASSASSRSFP